MAVYALVDVGGNLVVNLPNMTLEQAEQIQDELIEDGVGVRIAIVEPSVIEMTIQKSLAEKPELQGVIENYKVNGMSNDDILHMIRIGFCQPRFYKPAIWRQSKALMDSLVCPLGLAYQLGTRHDKVKYFSDFDKADVTAQIQQILCRKD